MRRTKFVALCGSLRRQSYNLSAIKALKALSQGKADIEIVSLAELPLFNPDRESECISEVAALKSKITKADGLIIASPEYAHGITGVMKNALDWLVSGEEFVDMPIMLINTSPRAEHAQAMLREVLTTMSGRIIEEAFVSIPLLGSKLDEHGITMNGTLSGALNSGLKAFCSTLTK